MSLDPPIPKNLSLWASAYRALAYRPQPRELQPNDISLYESLDISFFEALFKFIN